MARPKTHGLSHRRELPSSGCTVLAIAIAYGTLEVRLYRAVSSRGHLKLHWEMGNEIGRVAK